MKTIIKKLIIEYKTDWDLQIGKALAAMRWHSSTVTGFSPYQVLLFGRRPFLPAHLELPNDFNHLSLRAEDEEDISRMVGGIRECC